VSELRQLVNHASHYLAGRAGLMMLGFVSFPVLTRILPVAQYGELSLLLKLALLWTVLSKCGLQNAALRFFPEQSKLSVESKRACASTLIVSSVLVAATMAALGFSLVRWRIINPGREIGALLPLVVALICVRSIQPIFSGLLRAEKRTWLFNMCEISGKSLGILLSVGALSLIAVNLHYYLAGLVIAEGSVVIAVAIWFRNAGLLSFRSVRPRFAGEVLLFSAPLIAYELTSVVLDSGDRILISHYLGLTQVGLYSAAYSIATYAEEALMTPVNMALLPAYMKVWVENGAEATSKFLSQALDLFLMACGMIALLVYVTSDDLISILASKKFAAAHSLLPILVCGLLVYALHIFFNAPLLIYKRSIVLTCVTAISCVVNLAINVVLLPRIGIMGAAVATLISYAIFVVVLAIVSRRYMLVHIPINTFISVVALVAVIQAVMRVGDFPAPWINLLLKVPVASSLYIAGLLVLRPQLRLRLLSRRAPKICNSETLTVVGQ
jgi:O-antigen/teichoic acid export membrane protein